MERIFIDKIFATEFYYIRNDYEDVSKHLYDISIMMKNDDIKKLLKNKAELNKLISYKRKEEKIRKGGISEEKRITDFEYMKLNFNERLIESFNRMQKIYVLDDESIITIDDVKAVVKTLLEVFTSL